MMKLAIILMLVAVATVAIPSTQIANAHLYNFGTEEDLTGSIKFCEAHYDEFPLVGKDKFWERHSHFPGIRNCILLYEHFAWNSNHPSRESFLSNLLIQLQGDSNYLKDRHIEDFSTIPDWVKSDTKRWYKGIDKDSNYAYSIKALIDLQLIIPPVYDLDKVRHCTENFICVANDDFVKYAITDSFGKDIVTVKYTFGENTNGDIHVISEKISKEGKITNDFTLSRHDGFANLEKEMFNDCCTMYNFVYPTPLKIGDKITGLHHEMKIIGESFMPYDNIQRTVLIAEDDSGNFVETIDKETGAVIYTKYDKFDIIYQWKKLELVDTNIFQKKTGLQEGRLHIPDWWKQTAEWWALELITDQEFANALEYLLGTEELRI